MDTQALRAVQPARPRRHRRPRRSSAEKRARGSAGSTCTRSSTTTPAGLLELHDDERAATVTAFIERALALLRRARHHRRAADDRQRVPTPTTARCANCSPTTRSTTSRTRPYRPADQRQGRALPADPEPRMGLRPIPLKRPPRAALPHWLQHYNTRSPTAPSATAHPSAAFTTSGGRTPRTSQPGLERLIQPARNSVTVVFPGTLVAEAVPPWASTRPLAIGRPRPLPAESGAVEAVENPVELLGSGCREPVSHDRDARPRASAIAASSTRAASRVA